MKKKGLENNIDLLSAQIEELKGENRRLKLSLAEANIDNTRVQELANTKSLFLANMSHEIRTPMNSIMGFLGLLQNSELGEVERDYVDTAYHSAEALLGIVNDILDFSKIEARKYEFNYRNFNLHKFLKEVIKSFHPLVSERQICFLTEIEEDLPEYVVGDSIRLRQIFVNLIGNALKFTPAGGAVILGAHLRSTFGEGCEVHFSVTDTGIGVPEEKLQEILKPFEQGDSSTTREYGGTGLGLTISHELIQCMGGKLEVASKEGLGAVFSFNVRFKLGEKEKAPLSEGSLPHDNVTRTILIVEDNMVNQKLAVNILKKEGYKTVVANNGEEAIQLTKENQFDLILMDIQMPLLGGIQATESIRNMKGGEKIPIVAFTANAMVGDREQYIEAGMDEYISKPIKKDELKDVIQKFFNEDST